MNTVDLTELTIWGSRFFLAFCRIGGFFVTFVAIRYWIPATVRILLALALALSASFQETIAVQPLCFSVRTLLGVAGELATGVLLSMTLAVYFGLFVLAGQLVGRHMALGLSEIADPGEHGSSTTVVTQVFQLNALGFFFLIDGHLVTFVVLLESMTTLPPGHFGETLDRSMAMVRLVSWMFGAGLLIALPIITTLLVVNMVFGCMARTSPGLNILTLGFPLTIPAGVALLYLTVTFMPSTLPRLAWYALEQLKVFTQP